jgi:hypothetical protein
MLFDLNIRFLTDVLGFDFTIKVFYWPLKSEEAQMDA